MSVPAYSALVNPQLLGDLQTVGGVSGLLPTPTQVAGVNVSAFLEIQSPTNALGFLNARLTTTQINAMTVVNGMQAYNSTLGQMQAYIAGGWSNLLNAEANLNFPAALPAATSTFNISTGGVVTYDTQPVLKFTGSLTAAQMTGLNTAAITIGVAPGAGFMYLVDGVFFEVLSTGHTAFATGGNVAVQYGSGAGNTNYASVVVANTFFNNATNFTISAAGNVNSTTGLASTVTNNAPIAIGSTVDFTAGAGSSVNYIVRYRIVPVV